MTSPSGSISRNAAIAVASSPAARAVSSGRLQKCAQQRLVGVEAGEKGFERRRTHCSARPAGERIARRRQFGEQRGERRIVAVALDDDGQRLRRQPAEFGQQGKDLGRHIVEMVVEQPACAVRAVDPPAAGEVHAHDPVSGKRRRKAYGSSPKLTALA